MSLLGPDRLLVGRSVVDRKEARCIHCMQPIKFGPKGEPGVVHSREGMKEMGISGMCETCFDNLSGEPDDGTFLEFKRSADEDEPCPCAGGTATCRGNCPIFDKVAKQDAAQPSQAPVVQAVPENCGTGHCSCIECVVEPQAVRMLTKEEPEKCYSLDEETFHDLGDFIDMLDEEQAQPGFLVYEGESDWHTASHYARGAVSDLFERMGEQAFDDAGEHIGDWPDNTVKGDKLAELERLINDWLDANVKVHFYTVKNVRQIALTPEMLSDDDAGRTIPASGEIGGAA